MGNTQAPEELQEDLPLRILGDHETAEAAAQAYVVEAIRSHRVIIFLKKWDDDSYKMKRAMSRLLAPHQYTCIELRERADGRDIKKVLVAMTRCYIVPYVFVDGKYIPGKQMTKAMRGELSTALSGQLALDTNAPRLKDQATCPTCVQLPGVAPCSGHHPEGEVSSQGVTLEMGAPRKQHVL